MQLFKVEYCGISQYSLVFSRKYKWLPRYSNVYHEKGLHNYSDWLHFYGQGMKQINSCLIEGINYHITIILTTLVGNVFFPDILKEVPPQVLSGMLIY